MLNISIHPGALCIVADCALDLAVGAVLEGNRQDPSSWLVREEEVDLSRGHTKTMTFDGYGDKTVIQCNWADATEVQRFFRMLRPAGVESAIAFYYKLYADYPAPNVNKQAESYAVFRLMPDLKTYEDFTGMPVMMRGLHDYTKKWYSLTRNPELFGEKRNLLNAKKLTEILARFDIAPVFNGPIPENRVSYRLETDGSGSIDWEALAEKYGFTVTEYRAEPPEQTS